MTQFYDLENRLGSEIRSTLKTGSDKPNYRPTSETYAKETRG